MRNLCIYYSGGVVCQLFGLSEELTEAFIAWLNNVDEARVFTLDIPTEGKCRLIRKDLILFIEVT